MANNGLLQATVLSSEPLYYGNDVKGKEYLGPEEFLERQEALMRRNAPQATDLQKIGATIDNLRGSARHWWNTSLPNNTIDEDLNLYNTNWTAFKRRFRQEYFPVSNKADMSINWAGFTQRNGESAYYYLMRVQDSAMQFAKFIKTVDDEERVAEEWNPPPKDNNPRRDLVIAALADCTNLQKEGMADYVKDVRNNFRKIFITRYTTCMVLKVVMNGLKDQRLRATLLRSASDDDNMQTTLLKLKAAEQQLPKTHAKNHAINDPEEPNEDAVEGMAKTAKNGKKNRNRKGNKGDQKPTPTTTPATTPKPDSTKNTTPGAKCGFCNRQNHVENQCFAKKRHQAEQMDLRKTDNVPNTKAINGQQQQAAGNE